MSTSGNGSGIYFQLICFLLSVIYHPGLPSGKQPHNELEKSPCFMGKSTISMAIFNSFLYVYQRVWLRRWAPGASDFFTGLWKTMVHLVSDDVGIHKSSTLKISHGICKYRDISWYLMISHDISWYLLFSEKLQRLQLQCHCFLGHLQGGSRKSPKKCRLGHPDAAAIATRFLGLKPAVRRSDGQLEDPVSATRVYPLVNSHITNWRNHHV